MYDVYIYYQLGTNRCDSAPYKIVYDGGTVTSVQNQYSSTPNQGNWFLIGEDLPFAIGTAGYVELANNSQSTALVSADAAKFIYKGSADSTPPTTPIVTDGGAYTPSRTSLTASWTSSDPESGISESEYRIVEQSSQEVVVDWTGTGQSMQITATGLSLVLGKTYVFEIRTTNGAGKVSTVGVSDGIAIFPFDIDNDGIVSTNDLGAFLLCASGPTIPYATGGGVDCGRFDTNADADVDQEDFGIFQRCMTGTSLVNISCLNN